MTTHDKLKTKSFNEILRRAENGEKWAMAHYNNFHTNPIGRLIDSLICYADNHFKRFESRLGDDYILGAAWRDMVAAAITLLNGELGALDAGTCDGLLRDMLALEGFDIDTYEAKK